MMRKGQHLTPKQSADLSAARKGYRASPEARVKMSNAHKGKKHALETRAKMSISHIGKKHSAETCAKISAAKKGKKASAETQAKMMGNQNGLGHQVTQESRAKIGAAHWMGGISKFPYAWTFNEELKEEVRRRDGYCCQLCGVPQAECRTKLPVHHVDYDKKNSDPVNLTALCGACNSKVNANRAHWTAFFQAMAIRRNIAEKDRAERERKVPR